MQPQSLTVSRSHSTTPVSSSMRLSPSTHPSDPAPDGTVDVFYEVIVVGLCLHKQRKKLTGCHTFRSIWGIYSPLWQSLLKGRVMNLWFLQWKDLSTLVSSNFLKVFL